MQPMRILIVDDHAALRKSMAEMLEKQEDVEAVVEASNGAEALTKLMEQSFDIMITDIVMPVMDGYTLMEEMRRLRLASLPKVIVATALARDDFVMRAVELGAKFYLVKPFEPENLLGHIRELANGLPASLPVFPQTQPSLAQSIDDKLSSLFLTIGIPAHIKGYQYLRAGVKMVVENPDVINRITKELYPGIAAQFGTTASKVERAIRHAIEVAWNRGRIESINKAFGCRVCTPEDKPTNGEFIAMIADKLSLERSA
ncbi:MAG: sporulation transcription factor Spo0A [Clostridiales bacterium]|nr:sporulation transcription factor Spo0A [Clostridiales bacterium]